MPRYIALEIGLAIWPAVAARTARIRESVPRRLVSRKGLQVEESLEDYVGGVLAPRLRAEFPDMDKLVLDGVALMAYLGPATLMAPMPALMAEYLQALCTHARSHDDKEQLGMTVQLAIAYGLQWGRSAVTGDRRWDEHWPGALREIHEISRRFIIKTLNGLSFGRMMVRAGERGKRTRGVRMFAALHWEVSASRRRELIADATNCVVGLFLGLRPAPADTQKLHYQALVNWDPQKASLYCWTQICIRGGGPQDGCPEAKWFERSLLYEFLNSDGRVAVGEVAFQRCLHCQREWEYDGGDCPKGHGPGAIISKDVLVVPWVYLGRAFWRCSKCRFCFELYADGRPNKVCTACRHPREAKQRVANLLVRSQFTFTAVVPEDDDEEESHEST